MKLLQFVGSEDKRYSDFRVLAGKRVSRKAVIMGAKRITGGSVHARQAFLTVLLLVGTFVALSLAGCSSGTSSSNSQASSSGSSSSDGYTTISVDEAKALIDAGGVTIVDVRTQSEYESAHIPGAVLVTLDTIGTSQPQALPDLNAKLLVYCRTGVRSAQASAALAKIGYTQVYNMSGGITAWTYDTVSGS